MTGIHYVFPPEKDDEEDGISLKKILKKEGAWAIIKNVLGFEFDGNPGEHTTWITEERRIPRQFARNYRSLIDLN